MSRLRGDEAVLYERHAQRLERSVARALGSRWWDEGGEWEVSALRAPHSARNETPWWFVLVARPGQSPHPCDWWPERSFLRLFRHIESA